jgi:hypothetical protein
MEVGRGAGRSLLARSLSLWAGTGTDSTGTYRLAATYLTFYMRTVINRNVETGSDPKSS